MVTPRAESVVERGDYVGPPARPELWLCRHGETEWSRSGRHTSHTDLDLSDAGRRQAVALGAVLGTLDFDLVLTSPLRRARNTAELSGYRDAVVEPDAVEWSYGAYEGLTTPEIRASDPGWTIWHGAVPGGEVAAEVAARADRIVAKVRAGALRRALLFAHGHVLRVLAARWVGLGPERGESLKLDTATLSTLGWEREAPAVVRWNLSPEPPETP